MLKRNATDFFRFFCEIRVLQDKRGKDLAICGQIHGQNLKKIFIFIYVFSASQCADTFTISYMTQNKFSVCKAVEGGDAVASLTGNNVADGTSGKSFDEM